MAATAPQFENHLDAQEAKWFAVYTKYKSEKSVQKMLRHKEIETYLPIQKVTRRYTRKIKHLELPLIHCHIFVKIKTPEYVPVLETEGVIKFVRIARNLISIPEREMEIMRRVVGEGYTISAEPTQMLVGDKVEIVAGTLTGLQGVLVEEQGNKSVIVELERAGFQFRLNIPSEYLIKLQNTAAQNV